jgi:hypothetical protein
MQLYDFLSEMGYRDSPNFLSGDMLSTDSDNGFVYRKAIEKCSLKGAYVLRPPSDDRAAATVPVVYVCEAHTEADANAIHKKVWNQGIVPFLVVLGPNSIRLYSGFKYHKRPSSLTDDANDGLLRAAIQFNAIARELHAFQAESIDDGTVWQEWGDKASPEDKVDWRLLHNLDQLDHWLMSDGVPDRSLSHALIGKCVYLQYLRAREILSDRKLAEWGVEWDQFFSRNASLPTFRLVLQKVKEWLNGSVFPLSDAAITRVGQQRLREVVGTFRGDSPGGQLHLDFEAYDFSFIPIETLSVIYEQFLHSAENENEESKGKARGAYYTPLPLVGYVIDRLNQIKPLNQGMRVLDLACGSGAFLVQCYRKMIEQHLRRADGSIRPVQLRQLLTDHIFGIDSDPDACQLAELSLIMTLLDYVEPPDLTSTTFKLPELGGKNIVRGDAFDENCIETLAMDREKPAWIVGNPPWKELKQRSLDNSERRAFGWIGTHKQDRPTGGNQVAEAFAWLARDVVAKDGAVGLVMPAMTLSKYESRGFRREFFRNSRVLAVANFSNLAEVLFSGRSRAAAAAFFFSPLSPETGEWPERVEVYSPLVVNEVAHRQGGRRSVREKIWNITVNASEIRDVLYSEILDGDALPWKLASWGSGKDRKLLSSISSRFQSVRALDDAGHLSLSQGMELTTQPKGRTQDEVEYHPELAGKAILNVKRLKGMRSLFHIPAYALDTIPEDQVYVPKRAGFSRRMGVCRPPHIIVSAARTFAIYSERFVVIPSRQIGISENKGNAAFLKALSLYLNSDFVKYQQILTSPQFGVQRARSTLQALKDLPVPFLPDSDLKPWVDLHRKLVQASAQDDPNSTTLSDLILELNDLTNLALMLDDRSTVIVHDFVHVRMCLRDGKTETPAVRAPKVAEMEAYATRLKSELDSFLGGTNSERHTVRIVRGPDFGMVRIDVEPSQSLGPEIQVLDATTEMARELRTMQLLLRERSSQWIYFNRNLRIYEGTTTYIAKPMQRLHWLESQAMLDANEIIAETLEPALSNEGSESSHTYGQFR